MSDHINRMHRNSRWYTTPLALRKAIYFLIHKSEWSKYWIVIFMSKSTSVSSITNIL
jgi:hypothetical protein